MPTNPHLIQALTNLFAKQRLVFWYDSRQEFGDEFAALELPGVEKITLANNEFGVKYRVLRQQPEQKFLLYREGPEPPHLENWLLDVQLASGLDFRTDQAALWLAELGLGQDAHPLLEAHAAFFGAGQRREALRKLLTPLDTHRALRLKLLAVCAGAEPRLDLILEALLAELARDETGGMALIQASGLEGFLWEQVKRSYGYVADAPGLRDFVLTLFLDCFLVGCDPNHRPRLGAEALVFIKRWKDSRSQAESFETLSEQCAAVLGIDERLHGLDYRDLMELDYFELIDRKILSELVNQVRARTLPAQAVEQWVRQRRQGHWFERFADLYQAVEQADQFLRMLDLTQLDLESLSDGARKYAQTWFRLDQRYRKFIHHARRSGQASLLGDLATLVENRYQNHFLLRLNDRWQVWVDAADRWEVDSLLAQRDFFQRRVRPYLERQTKVCVLISDALRYEIGEELAGLIRREDRFEAELEPALAVLPSYTQLGMAALLPHRTLGLAADGSGEALADGQSTQGSANRARLLAVAVPDATLVLAKDLLVMTQTATRALVRDHDLIYVYHNHIDKTGDGRDTEERVFAAAEETLLELRRLVKKLTNANASNLLITADHGFLYQDRPPEESDFLSQEPEGEEIRYRDRRFVLGLGLRPCEGLRTFTAAQLGLAGDLEVQIPKSIQRLRRKGSGSRFVHGGTSLQEVIIPVLRIHKRRQSDVGQVEVEIIEGGGRTITTGQVALVLYQTTPVTAKQQPRTLRAGLFTLAGEAISDQHELTFDLTADNPREREVRVRFLLSRQAEAANNQPIELRLDEPVASTSHYRRYKAARYTLRRSFTSEFDF